MPFCFWMITGRKKANNFQIAKVQSQVTANGLEPLVHKRTLNHLGQFG